MSNPFTDFELAGGTAPLPPLDGAQILVHVVVNLESWPIDRPMPRKLLGSPHGRDHVPDVPNFSWVEYGLRCGLPRVFETLTSRGLAASASINSSIVSTYPQIAELVVEAGWEWIAHGVIQRALPDSDDEAAVIAEALDQIEGFTGTRPTGWLGPGLHESFETPSILSAAGVEYVSDWGLDDRPTWLHAEPNDLVSLPYGLELNDSLMFAAQWHPIEEYERRIAATAEVFTRECERTGDVRVLTLGIHPHLIGVPHRIQAFERVLDRLAASPLTRFVDGAALNRWFRAAHGR